MPPIPASPRHAREGEDPAHPHRTCNPLRHNDKIARNVRQPQVALADDRYYSR